MGRVWCHQPYGDDKEVSIFSCKRCKVYKKLEVQLTHLEHIKYWEILGPVLTGVFVMEALNIIADKTERFGLFFKQGKHVMFDPYVVDRHSTEYFNIYCKICKSHVGYEIPTLSGFVLFYSTLF